MSVKPVEAQITMRSAPCSAYSGNRITQLFVNHTFEDLAVVEPIETAQHIVEGAVLEQHHDDMVEPVCRCWRFSDVSSPVRTIGMGNPAIPSSVSVYFTVVASNDGQPNGDPQ